ncbi:MAG: DUF896 domain-containing protein [Acutalibacteraceae bacterium]|nr:DUF896 domain-containing protein [Clostridia bacterium]MEE1127114.1 DUF896 domain-containing protein [Acutalibacteraceae bacterium]MBQ2001096.1 DUF896 domain-containing protein [Clostridia bacterium]MBQ2319107.1 DUF896 domain-containing protein [Clostridia bacterium]MBQ2420736.1 DUF896 domain-containing protein [Clostridia bacterium]
MVTEQQIKRINELAKKQREVGLTEEEKAEQAVLRRAYIDGFKASLEGQLNSITVVEKDGSKHKLEKKK